jgi:hypothetical protein
MAAAVWARAVKRALGQPFGHARVVEWALATDGLPPRLIAPRFVAAALQADGACAADRGGGGGKPGSWAGGAHLRARERLLSTQRGLKGLNYARPRRESG